MAKVTLESNTNLFENADKEVRVAIPQLVDRIVAAVDVTKDAKDAETELKDQLREFAKEEYWDINFSRNINNEPTHVFDAVGRRNVAQVNFIDKFAISPEQHAQLVALFGKNKKLLDYIQTNREVKVDITGATPETQIEFMKELAQLCQDYGFEGTMTTDRKFTPEFHNERHNLIPALNKQIDKIVPMQVHITTTATQ